MTEIMNKLSFQQDPGLSRDTLILNEVRLVISSKAVGLSMDKVLELKELSPHYELRQQRFWPLYIIPVLFAVVMLVMTGWLSNQKTFPQELAIWSALGFAFSLWHVFNGFRPIEVSVFRSNDGEKLVEIYKPRKVTLGKGAKSKDIYKSSEQTIGYEEFVAALSDRIKANASNACPLSTSR